MKIAACCLTFRRPKLLGRVIETFSRQTWTNSELVILDDAGDYPEQPRGDRWRIVSVNERYPSLGAKRNACVSLVSDDVDAVQTWDDDDVMFPWMLESVADALRKGVWARGSEAFEWDGEKMSRIETFNRSNPSRFAYHGHWSYLLDEFWKVGGYPEHMDDDLIWQRMTAAYGPSVDLISKRFPEPAYVYSREPTTHHLSWLYPRMSMPDAWQSLKNVAKEGDKLTIGWDREYDKIPRPSVAQPRMW